MKNQKSLKEFMNSHQSSQMGEAPTLHYIRVAMTGVARPGRARRDREKRRVSEKFPRLVMVDWVDSAQPYAGWRYLRDLPELEVVRCETVGWLVARDDQVLMLAQNLGDIGSESAQASGLMRIPAACVTRVTELFEGDAEKSYD